MFSSLIIKINYSAILILLRVLLLLFKYTFFENDFFIIIIFLYLKLKEIKKLFLSKIYFIF